MADNNVYRGLILRDETIVTSQITPDALNYYVREGHPESPTAIWSAPSMRSGERFPT